ncbi:hypothetical protein HRR83_008318 [Exophiala dermatitidis]|uniref:Uncharacterized protein n=2 Tax=Exophiala dermatitidis TaxID=5970 RepID=H6C569_EXODN|nr:uncharacterized protein HMPREF1120_07763 [Exophiala dermatitidis NIH/UT8656]KAJ4505468.1 hypothetical protein HRR75_007337 [Exophiala dermatitidis]EHY59781.1 hypothetical protein HMPREF1120_07763 [Exophiala dermatitidis NIH/UT8656]KAJ4507070.1 hypothetical protein HRR73_007891 [Exophiala dermatitidis]KAJ4507666.1 hypothetical protein HRR74_007993 [Exophiala dermatitidis]KAJ4533031.1 hypothetical protein HRR76_008002 [Exophiala dermatitidis]
MLRHGYGLHKRAPQGADGITGLPASIGNPTATLPQSIAPSDIRPNPSSTAEIVTASAPSGLTTITETQTLVQSVTSLNTLETITTEKVRTITDSSEYASLTSAAAVSSTSQSSTSNASSSATTSAAAAKSSSNIATLVPAIVVPLVVVLLASLGAFWFFMRRRHRRELASQPEFVMTGKGEKLSSRSNSGRSTSSELKQTFGKKSPAVNQKELPPTSSQSPPHATSEWPSAHIGVARPLTPRETTPIPYNPPFAESRSRASPSEPRQYRNFSGPVPTSGKPGPEPPMRGPGQFRDRSDSLPSVRGPPPLRTGPGERPRIAPSPVPRGGPSPAPPRISPARSPQGLPGNAGAGLAGSAFRFRDPSPTMNHSARAQAPPRLAAPPPGAYNGASSISQYSPIVKDAPNKTKGGPSGKKGPPPAIYTTQLSAGNALQTPSSASPQGNVLTEENVRIARLANSTHLTSTPAEPSPSPKLPPPATRSQLIPRYSLKDDKDDASHYSRGTSEQFGAHVQNHTPASAQTFWRSNRTSLVSEPDDYEDIEAKSDVSSLNEFERFDFGPDIGGSRGGSSAGVASLNYYASQHNFGNGSGSPFGDQHATHERW